MGPRGGPLNKFTSNCIFGKLTPNVNFQNPRTTPFGRKLTDKKKKRRKTSLIVASMICMHCPMAKQELCSLGQAKNKKNISFKLLCHYYVTRGNLIMLLFITWLCVNLLAGFLARDCYEGIQTFVF